MDDQRLAEQTIRLSHPPRFYDIEYPLSASMVEGKNSVTVLFEASPNSRIATVFGIRMIRAGAEG